MLSSTYTQWSLPLAIEERPEPPIDKPDPTEPVKVTGTKEQNGYMTRCSQGPKDIAQLVFHVRAFK